MLPLILRTCTVAASRTSHPAINPLSCFPQLRALRRIRTPPRLLSEPYLTHRSLHSMPDPQVRPGSCLCKTVRYEVTGEPRQLILCHCSNCKISSGSAFMTHSLWEPDQLKITQGEASVRHYEDSDTKSGNTMTRSFCSNCGSPLFVKPKRDFIIIQPSGIEGHQDWTPTEEIYAGSKVNWLGEITVAKKSFS